MKSLLVSAFLIVFVAGSLSAQTTNTATAPATPAAAPAAEGPKTDATADATNEVAKAAANYPVTAVVSNGTITFPVLLSKDSEPLMTNAVFHRTFGRKVIFGADIEVKSFDIDKLHPSVIAQLDLNPDKVKTDQETLNKQNQEWAAKYQQQNQQYLAAEAAALKSQAAAQAAAAAASTNGTASPAPGTKHSKRSNNPNNGQNPPPPPPSN
jgi:hypothetical protein